MIAAFDIDDPHGENFIDGGAGADLLVVYEGNRNDYEVYRTAEGRIVVEGPGANGLIVKQEMVNVEQILIHDGVMDTADVLPDPTAPPDSAGPDEPLIVDPYNEITGTESGEWISGTERNDLVRARGGDDAIHAPIGENFIDEGSGIDTLVVYEGDSSDFNVYRSSNGRTFFEGPGGDWQCRFDDARQELKPLYSIIKT